MTKQEIYDVIGNSPQSWLNTARNLIDSAQILDEYFRAGLSKKITDERSFRVRPSSKMLYGFGIECLLKGVWVNEGNEITKRGIGKYKQLEKDKHDLNEISNTVCFDRNADEWDLLKRLTIIMRSIGRYPIAKNYLEYSGKIEWVGPKDYETLNTILQKLITRINSVAP